MLFESVLTISFLILISYDLCLGIWFGNLDLVLPWNHSDANLESGCRLPWKLVSDSTESRYRLALFRVTWEVSIDWIESICAGVKSFRIYFSKNKDC